MGESGEILRLFWKPIWKLLRICRFILIINMLLKIRLLVAVLISLAVLPSATPAQSLQPAAEYQSLLRMRFSDANGEFQAEGLQIVFPPKDEATILTVNRSSGEEIFRLHLRSEPSLSSPLFDNLIPDVEPGAIKVGQSGDFILMIKVSNRVITRFPFTLKAEPEVDPYDPPKRFRRDGPWRDLAYFSLPVGDNALNLDFNWWMSLRELPTGMTDPQVSIHLMLDSREIASSRDRLTLDSLDWQFFTSDLIQATKFGPQHLTLGELAQREGDYLLIVEANGTPIKSYRLEVKDGWLQRPDQSRLDFEPHVDFMSPRLIDTSTRSDSHKLIRDVYWVRRTEVTATFGPRPDAK